MLEDDSSSGRGGSGDGPDYGADDAGGSADDPVRMYLTQMGEIPLLKRADEIRLAREIELTRLKFRAKLLECDYVMQHAVRTLRRVHENDLPFDRVIQANDSDNLEKGQIRGRFPHNLRSLKFMLERIAEDYRVATSRSASPEARAKAWKDLGRRRRRAVRMVEELGLRTQRLESMIETLANYSKRVDDLKSWIDTHRKQGLPAYERRQWQMEYRNILQMTQE
ncbi:MAG: RNA polymerase subunit sigma-70, partial [Thermoguttaceae bacterium]|nr:RNA polymerase subunit sigma-70 [Thermoguttaceae bacterium]